MNIEARVKEFVLKLNEKGIPLPLLRIEGKASLSATFAFISFNIWVISVVGKWSGYLGGVDSGQCLQMFLACAGLYWGRKFQKGDTTLEATKKEENK